MSTWILLASSPIFVLGGHAAKQGRARDEGGDSETGESQARLPESLVRKEEQLGLPKRNLYTCAQIR